ncbi:hypothetical protein ERD78_15975 [Allopusillimonas soli]|uniref:Cell division protein ZipA n=1 Tax=Allopusillimonas soli TaxID=659016 RepID=A0A853FBX0_9BURK|nr:cell division protein ZipA C-terminal FtsZ-binding domain-containing protein [Allopusillimonas soli]NYT38284.1 hypothetical protein [Allopusillimonas soli]TEA72143.1 hypothetical protein ERD78_15975 [Allopusillimonas soli]
MSDLQIGLILLGVILILIVLIFNWWQDRRIRRKMQEHFPEREQDPLMSHAQAGADRREPGLAQRAPDDDAGGEAEVDGVTEAVIDIAFAQPVPSEQLYEAIASLDKVGTKPVRVIVEREGGGHRSRLRPQESYVSMQLAVLLANRRGALTDIEWSQLWAQAQGLAERFDGAVEGPEQAPVMQQAQELDALCAGLDAQVGLALRMPQTRSLSDVSRVLKDAGFLPYQGQLAWMSDQGRPRFTVLFDGVHLSDVQADGVNRVDLLLDLPNSPADEQAFSRMASVGRDLARRLDAELLDDQGRPVSESADQAIDGQLLEMYERLGQAGFVAGSERTIRVFS